jgi:signal transduction histidine kinase
MKAVIGGVKQRDEKDERIKAKHFSWRGYLLTYLILLSLAAGQWLIYAEYMDFEQMPVEYIFGMLGYWALVTAGYLAINIWQRYRSFERPLRKLSAAAKQVASGDFSVYLEPVHKADKHDYVDVMFEDFNTMVEGLGSTELLKNDFIADVSHEIKTPLAVIQNYAAALQKTDLPEETRKEYAGTIISAADRLNALVSNILKLSKLENQEITSASGSYDLCRQLSECALAFEDALEEKHIVFTAGIEDKVLVDADESMLEIVWHNLLANAIKFTESGGAIALTQTSDADCVTVTITDNGCGMDDVTLKHVFDKFYQGDTSHSGDGNGLGLALVSRVIELVGGTITVQSEPGAGSTFSVTLPTHR